MRMVEYFNRVTKIAFSGVIIVQTTSIPIHNKAGNFLHKNLKGSYVLNLKGKGEVEGVADKLKNSTVVAIGTRSMELLTEEGITPFLYIFGLPLNKFYQAQNTNLISILPDYSTCIKVVTNMFPHVKRIGLLISTSMSGYLMDVSNEIKKYRLQPVGLVGSTPSEGLYMLSSTAVDLVFTFPDPKILTPASYKLLLKEAKEKNFIVVAPSPQLLSLGGHLAMVIDEDRALSQALSILKNPVKGKISVGAPLKEVLINKKWMKGINFKIPKMIALSEMK